MLISRAVFKRTGPCSAFQTVQNIAVMRRLHENTTWIVYRKKSDTDACGRNLLSAYTCASSDQCWTKYSLSMLIVWKCTNNYALCRLWNTCNIHKKDRPKTSILCLINKTGTALLVKVGLRRGNDLCLWTMNVITITDFKNYDNQAFKMYQKFV